MSQLKFGLAAPIIGPAPGSQENSIFIDQQAHILPTAAEHFHSIWVFDHFFGVENRQEPFLECWTTLTWLAARFPDLHIGTLVLGIGYRNPGLLAKMSATLQLLSGGRLLLGVGAGWLQEEYLAYGYPFPPASVRVKQLDEAIQIMRLMWSEPAPSFKGDYFQITEAACPPRPDPLPPIMIGGEGEQLMLPLIARQADWWNTGKIDPPTYRRKRDILHRLLEAEGRDPADMVHSFMMSGRRLPQSTAESEQWIEALQPFIDLGVTYFMLSCGPVASAEQIVRLAEEVMQPLTGA